MTMNMIMIMIIMIMLYYYCLSMLLVISSSSSLHCSLTGHVARRPGRAGDCGEEPPAEVQAVQVAHITYI